MHRLTILSLRWPKATIGLFLLLTAVAGWLAVGLRTVTGTHAQLGASHPVVKDFEAFLEQFGGGYPVVIAWSCSESALCETIFDPASLEMAYELTHALEQSSAVIRVSSPATSPVLIPTTGQGFEIRRFVEEGTAVPDRARLQSYAMNDPLWKGALVSRDARVGALVVEMASTESDALFTVVRDIRAALEPMERQGFRYHLVGQAIVEVALHEDGTSDGAKVAGGTSILIMLTVFLLTRSWPAVLAVFANIGGATAWVAASMRMVGWPLDPITSAAPTVILVVGAADAIHLFSRYSKEKVSGISAHAAMIAASRAIGPPCVMTTLTTASAFLSFLVSETAGMARFGVLAALGVGIALLLCFTVLPVLLIRLSAEGRAPFRATAVWGSVLDQLVTVSTRRAGLVLVGTGVLTILCALGIPKLRVEVDVHGYWGPDGDVPRWARFVADHLREPDAVEIELALPAESSFVDPQALAVVGNVAEFVKTVDGLARPRSILDPIAWTNRLVHDDDPGFERLPDSSQGIGELLTLLSLSNAGTLDPWITLDYRRVRVSTEAENLVQSERRRVLVELQQHLEELVPEDWEFAVTGPMPLFYQFVEDIKQTQLQSFSMAAVVIFGLLVVFLRSLRWGLLAMIPNLIPVIVLLGAMGHAGIFLDGGTAMVAPIAIGIAVDDTIHLLSEYARQRRLGRDSLSAIQAAMRTVGRALITTSAALALGFLAMLVSTFQSVANIGLLSAIAVIGALVADLLILPALIAVSTRDQEAPAE